MPHTHIAGASNWWLPDISATITIAVSGILTELARKPAMPTRAKAEGCTPHDAGRTRAKKRPVVAPSVAPQTRAGAKMPPEPPEPTVNEVDMTFRKNIARNTTAFPFSTRQRRIIG